MNSTIAKAAGWMQFVSQLTAQLAATGVPHGAASWAGLVGSFIVAIGMHAASATDGVK